MRIIDDIYKTINLYSCEFNKKDIIEIYSIFNNSELTIERFTIDKFLIEDIKDIDELDIDLTHKMSILVCKEKEKVFELIMEKNHVLLNLYQNNLIAESVYDKFEKFYLKKKKISRFRDIFFDLVSYVIIIYGFILVILSRYYSGTERKIKGIISIILILLGAISFMYNQFIKLLNKNRYNNINLKKKNSNFFVKYKDDLIKDLFVGIIILFLGYLIGKFL